MAQTILDELQQGTTLVLMHGNADADALASAVLLQRTYPSVTVGTAGGLDRLSKRLVDRLGIATVEAPDPAAFDRVVVCDASGPEQIPAAAQARRLLVVDHHAETGRWPAPVVYIDESRASCCEVVYDLLGQANRPIDRTAALVLLVGMITDTAHFRFANPATLRTFAQVLEQHGIGISDVLQLMELETDLSERIAVLKGAQRLRLVRAGPWLIASSHGSSFEASVCRGLLALGADVAFVGSQRDEHYRVSARAHAGLVQRGLHLGKLLGGIGDELNGGGGGHPGAAGIGGIGDVEAILHICVERTREALAQLPSELEASP